MALITILYDDDDDDECTCAVCMERYYGRADFFPSLRAQTDSDEESFV